MKDRVFLVALDATDPTADPNALTQLLRESRQISSWWHHLPFVFLVKCELGPDELSRLIRPHTGDVAFFVVETALSQSDGWLPEQAWRWIKRHSEHASSASVDTSV